MQSRQSLRCQRYFDAPLTTVYSASIGQQMHMYRPSGPACSIVVNQLAPGQNARCPLGGLKFGSGSKAVVVCVPSPSALKKQQQQQHAPLTSTVFAPAPVPNPSGVIPAQPLKPAPSKSKGPAPAPAPAPSGCSAAYTAYPAYPAHSAYPTSVTVAPASSGKVQAFWA